MSHVGSREAACGSLRPTVLKSRSLITLFSMTFLCNWFGRRQVCLCRMGKARAWVHMQQGEGEGARQDAGRNASRQAVPGAQIQCGMRACVGCESAGFMQTALRLLCSVSLGTCLHTRHVLAPTTEQSTQHTQTHAAPTPFTATLLHPACSAHTWCPASTAPQ